MLVDSPYVGDWMGSVYSARGQRIDYCLFLHSDGIFERRVCQEPDYHRTDRGRWFHKEGEDVLRLESESRVEGDCEGSDWWVLAVKSCEDSNCLMVLREAVLASRNLPILFYRVHLASRTAPEENKRHE